ncbi:hypothetical protein I7I51_04031 [Histoplasma capsulatum]|uniref:Uncharacterized protein n=1 Tax=Ajellomyces capsulatus TaxID=5037 RepID=A0A8A1MB71_AJECA|nr:hypothetical protein I7I51_04031 [Histoplasma capsulatum]
MWGDDEGRGRDQRFCAPGGSIRVFLACNDIFSLIQEKVLDVPEHDASYLKSLQGCSLTRVPKNSVVKSSPKSDGPCVTLIPAEDKLFEREMGSWDDGKGG